MRYLPVSLDLHGRSTVVIGGGEAATRNALALLDAGAVVSVIAQDISSELRDLAADVTSLRLVNRTYEAGDLQGAVLAFAATADGAIQEAVALEASERNIPLSVADEPDASTFTMPAVLELGPVTVAVSTGGANLALAQRIRDEIAAELGPEYASAAEYMASLRERFDRGPARAQAFARLLQSGLLEALRRGDPERVERMTESICTGLDKARDPAGENGS